MFLQLDDNGPAYAQLTRALKAAILDGRLACCSKLPSTRTFAKELGVSRITVLTAYEQLRAEGYIESHAGSASRVTALQIAPDLPVPKTTQVAPQSRYAQRMRDVSDWRPSRQHDGLRLDLQYYRSNANPTFTTAWAGELARAAKYTDYDYPGAQGLLELREEICAYLAHRRGVLADPEDVVIVNGVQQAITLTARVLLDEGSRVVIEDPHYFQMWNSLASHGATLLSIRTDNDGLVCGELPKQSPRLICVTPSHQFPSGVTLSLRRRLELLRYAESYQCWIFEDDYDSEFRYDSAPLAALRSLDRGARVIYAGTFSKVISGALRLGYLVSPKALRKDFIAAKSLCDFGSSRVEQAALAHFMQTGRFDHHLRKAGKALRERREVLIEALRQRVGDRVEIADSHAGMHLVVWLPAYDLAQVEALIDHAHERGLGLYPMAPYYQSRPPAPGLLLGYCGLSISELREAMRLFGECLDEIDAKRRS